ncbi:hypothetical protein NDU88_003414 [Pleurodeles waltl]|uniref:Uncharacterized protein n=1 Tax=Pleurodeles waltl TaxID=8319 RepID=A0AAV7Q8V2_PLEWA|nr:hypothetical protein NDU88_003414 [Pleurodeles waltl]
MACSRCSKTPSAVPTVPASGAHEILRERRPQTGPLKMPFAPERTGHRKEPQPEERTRQEQSLQTPKHGPRWPKMVAATQ